MRLFTREFILAGLTEQDFANWKHHPVTKVYLRFLRDWERQLAERQIGALRKADRGLHPFDQGKFAGYIEAISEMADLTFQDIANAYPSEEEQKQQETPTEEANAA